MVQRVILLLCIFSLQCWLTKSAISTFDKRELERTAQKVQDGAQWLQMYIISIGENDQRSIHDALAAATALETDFRSAQFLIETRSKNLEYEKTDIFARKGLAEKNIKNLNKKLEVENQNENNKKNDYEKLEKVKNRISNRKNLAWKNFKQQSNTRNFEKFKRIERSYNVVKGKWEKKKNEWVSAKETVHSMINKKNWSKNELDQIKEQTKKVAKLDAVYKKLSTILGSLALKGKSLQEITEPLREMFLKKQFLGMEDKFPIDFRRMGDGVKMVGKGLKGIEHLLPELNSNIFNGLAEQVEGLGEEMKNWAKETFGSGDDYYDDAYDYDY